MAYTAQPHFYFCGCGYFLLGGIVEFWRKTDVCGACLVYQGRWESMYIYCISPAEGPLKGRFYSWEREKGMLEG